MQKSSVFMVLCIGHIIGEYFLTNKYIVKKKDKKKIFCYCLAYIIPFIIIGMLFCIYEYNIGKICLECICIHFIIEIIKFVYLKYPNIDKFIIMHKAKYIFLFFKLLFSIALSISNAKI